MINELEHDMTLQNDFFYLLNTQAMTAVKLSKTTEEKSKSLNDNDAKPETTALI